jgi:hypothetical protein
MNERTIYRRMETAEFANRLRNLRSEMVVRTMGALTAASTEAVRTLLAWQKELAPAAVRLGAARSVLEIGMKLREIVELEKRVGELEERWKDADANRGNEHPARHNDSQRRLIGDSRYASPNLSRTPGTQVAVERSRLPREGDLAAGGRAVTTGSVSYARRSDRHRAVRGRWRSIPMKHASRVRRLETSASRVLPPPPPVHFDEEMWLEQFTVWGQNGVFDHEPDFKRALAMLRDSIAAARLKHDPPFDPPEYLMSDERHQWHRVECWRYKRFPDVNESMEWLQEMLTRFEWGIPPVCEAEYRELEAWFVENEPRLLEIEKQMPSLMLPLDDGERTVCWYVRYDLRQGPHAEGSGKAAEVMRKIRAKYGVDCSVKCGVHA